MVRIETDIGRALRAMVAWRAAAVLLFLMVVAACLLLFAAFAAAAYLQGPGSMPTPLPLSP